MKKFFCIISLIISTLTLHANDTLPKRENFLSLQYYRGPVFDHRKIGSLLNFGMPYDFSLQYWFQTDGRKQWEMLYKYPQLGFSVHYVDFDTKFFGKAVSGAALVKFVLKQNNFFSFKIDLQSGIAYITKPFDKDDNIYNALIGSHVNFFLTAGPEFEFFRSKNIFLSGGFSFTHFSNGSTQLPNLGINLMEWHAGVNYRLTPSQERRTYAYPQDNKRWQGDVIISAGWCENGQPCGPKYFITTLNTGFYRILSTKHKIGAGFDIMRDPSQEYYYVRAEDEYKDFDFLSSGFSLRYGLIIGKLTTLVQWGFFVKEPKYSDAHSYHRIGVNYQITKHLLANLSLKTTYAKANFIEFGFGYQW